MQNGEFEKSIQQKMEELRLTPSTAVWDKVELSLPDKEERKRWLFFILFFILLAGASFLLWNRYNAGKEKIAATKNNHSKNNTVQTEIQNEKTAPILADSNTSSTKKINDTAVKIAAAKNIVSKRNNGNGGIKRQKTNRSFGNGNNTFAKKENSMTVSNKTKPDFSDLTRGYTKTKNTNAHFNTTNKAGEEIATPHLKQYITKQKTITKVKAPVAVAEDEKNKETVNDIVKDSNQIAVATPLQNNLVDANDAKKQIAKDSLITIKKDTTATVNKAKENKKNNPKWVYGFEVALGISSIKINQFAGSNSNSNAVSGPPYSGTLPVIGPSTPTAGFGFNASFFSEKEFTKHWKFTTGLNYVYQSSKLQVGAQEDSSRTFSFGYSSIFTRDGYYLTGNTSSYKNKYHLLEIPVLMGYSFSKKSPFYLQGGTTVGYLLQSNALIYNDGYNEYFTTAALFNKLLLSITGGVGINFAQKTKLPFSFGYRFKYSVNSIVKTSFGEQRFVNSLLYIKIPLKK